MDRPPPSPGEGRGLIWPLCLLLTPEEQTLPIWVLLPREPGGASVEGVPASQGQSLKRHAAAGTCQGERDLKLGLSPLPTGEPWTGRWFWQDPEQMKSPPSSSSPGLLLECAISRARQASRGQRSNVVCSTRSRVALELRDSATVTSTVHPSGSPAAALRGPWHTRGLPPAAAALPGFDSQDGHFLSAVTLVPEKGHKVPVITVPISERANHPPRLSPPHVTPQPKDPVLKSTTAISACWRIDLDKSASRPKKLNGNARHRKRGTSRTRAAPSLASELTRVIETERCGLKDRRPPMEQSTAQK
ncbi:uncharacterized protein LOC131423618 [Marmota monax]|uniref:uncharacterized protein LOC131423618 n=1 Tax=Marmota monax TaxID=9995 RepID=UPI0026F1D244|nr:uncharacterized protein LOC131423618 [Marmota monax]